MSAQLVRLAATVLTSEKGRKTVGWVLAAILSPVILLVAFLCCVGSGTAEHNGAVVSAAFYGTDLSASVPEEYRAQLTQMRGSFAHLDAAVADYFTEFSTKDLTLFFRDQEKVLDLHLAEDKVEVRVLENKAKNP